jgi:ribosomal protein S18 acetylase RimI-like enzyme
MAAMLSGGPLMGSPPFTIREMTIADYEDVLALWRATPGLGLSEADGRQPIARFLQCNRGLSFVALAAGETAGAVLGCTDGRRGYLHHLAVAPERRRLGMGRALVERSLAAMRERGLRRCHIFVYADNRDGREFWERTGWFERKDLVLYSHDIPRQEP